MCVGDAVVSCEAVGRVAAGGRQAGTAAQPSSWCFVAASVSALLFDSGSTPPSAYSMFYGVFIVFLC